MELFNYIWIIPSSTFIEHFTGELGVISAFKQEMEFFIMDSVGTKPVAMDFLFCPWESHMDIDRRMKGKALP